jgi:hypothetical protein
VATAGWAAWYHFGRSSGATQLQTTHFDDSQEGLVIGRCQLNAQGTEVIAYGTFNKNAVDSGGTEVAISVAGGGVLLGHNTDNNVDVSSGGYWTIDASVKAGFGAPNLCVLGLY